MNFYLGKITEVVDDKKYIIKFTIDGYIENATAYPIDVKDQPEVGNSVMVFEMDTIFGQCFMYQKSRNDDYTRIKFLGNTIELNEYGIEITTEDGNDIEVDAGGDITVETKGTVNINVKTGNVTLKMTPGSILTVPKGTVIPDPTGGPFCAIPVCPLSGLPHTGNVLTVSQ